MRPFLPAPPVVRFAPLCLVPPPPAEKVERHLVTEAMVQEVRRALNSFAYGGLMMAVQLSTIQPGDTLYYPLPRSRGGYHAYVVVSVDPGAGKVTYTCNGRTYTGTQRNLNRFRRTPPKGRP